METFDVIDADGHLFETTPGAIDWAKYMPEGFKHRAPKSIPPDESQHGFLVDGKPFPASATSGARNVKGVPHHEVHSHRPGMWDPHVRVKDMDVDGIRTAVLFSSLIAQRTCEVEDPKYAVAFSQAYNNWLADYCRPYPQRLKGAASVPIHDMEATVNEVDRAVTQFGFVTVAVMPHGNGRNLDDLFYEPFYRELERLDVPLSSHYQGVRDYFGKERKYNLFYSHMYQHPLEQMMGFACATAGGVLDRHPRLRIAFLEGNVGWLPWWVDRLDEHYEKLGDQMSGKLKPSEYLAGSQCYFGCEVEEDTLGYVVDKVGAERIVYASDYWHWDATFPGSVKLLRDRTDLSDEAKRLILSENAKRLYRLNGNVKKK